MTNEEISVILSKHKKWINKEEGGERANLDGVDFENAIFRGAKEK